MTWQPKRITSKEAAIHARRYLDAAVDDRQAKEPSAFEPSSGKVVTLQWGFLVVLIEMAEKALRKSRTKKCIAREPLLYGSRVCEEVLDEKSTSDLCAKHRKLIAPHQIINGVFYVAREEDE